MELRPVPGSEILVERCADLADSARRLGRTDAADRYLLLAWAAYEDVELPSGEPGCNENNQAATVIPFPPRH